MKELISRIKAGIPVNGVVAVAKAGVGIMTSYNGKIHFLAEGKNEWEEIEV